MPAPLDDPLIGRLVDGRYQVGDRIARGGMATVYVATDLRLDRRVAIKVMHAHLADDAQFRERFIQEAHSAARLAHPNVVNIFDQGEEVGLAYLVMEHLPSITLRDLLLERGRVSPEQSLQVLEAVLAGLGAAHRAGIVHRDLKPENVLLAHDGRIKIADFGLARAASANTATGKALLGTIAYLSPELVTRGLADARSDIYAVGIMLFEMLTGKQPFTGEQPLQIAYQHAHEQVPAPSTLEPSVPHQLDLLVHWATHRDPNLRPADASEMLVEVQRVRAGGALDAASTRAQTRMLPVATAATTVLDREPQRGTTGQVRTERQRPDRSQRDGFVGTGDLPSFGSGEVPAAALALQRRAAARRRRGWVWFALVVVLALIAAGTGWWLNLGPGGQTVVPEIAQGTSEADATAALVAAGLEVAAEPRGEWVSTTDVPAGGLLATEPAAGAELGRGTPVTLVLSRGIEMLPAPALSGSSVDGLEAAITAAGFAPVPGAQVFDDAAAGTVLVVRLEDGTDVTTQPTWPRGTRMTYLVSRGPLPGLVGLDQAGAEAALASVGLTLGAVESEDSTEVPEGIVMRASYPPDVTPDSQAAVGIVVSAGPPQVAVPDVMAMTVANAAAAITAAGLVPAVESNLPAAAQALLTPTAVEPGAGTLVDIGSTVRIVASY